jgi:hypothetical protein
MARWFDVLETLVEQARDPACGWSFATKVPVLSHVICSMSHSSCSDRPPTEQIY